MKSSSSKISRFIKRLSPSIANKVDLQSYPSFEDVCSPTIKVEKQLKGRRSFNSSFTKSLSTYIEIKPHPHKLKLLTMVRELLVSHLKGWKGRNILSAIVMGMFKSIIPIERPLSLRK